MRKIWTPKIILPTILQEDERLNAAAKALERALADLSNAALEGLFLPRLDVLPSELLNALANQYHVDFFEPNMSDAEKRALIRDAIHWHRRKGTPSAVEEIMRKIYIDARVQEWYEYGGKPYYFKILQDITATGELTDKATLDRARAAVSESKNARSWLQWFEFLLTFQEHIYPVDAQQLLINQHYRDWYDYRANNKHHDGATDYGASMWHHDGHFKRDGSFSRKGWEYRARHGQLQASDFEILRFVFNVPDLIDDADSSDEFHMLIPSALHKDWIQPEDVMITRLLSTLFEQPELDDAMNTHSARLKATELIEVLERYALPINLPLSEYQEVFERLSVYEMKSRLVEQINAGEAGRYLLTLPLRDDVPVNDVFLIVYPLDAVDDWGVLEDRQEKYFATMQTVEEVSAEERLMPMSSTMRLEDTTETAAEKGLLEVTQKIAHNRRFSRNGQISHSGSKKVLLEWIKATEEESWRREVERLRWEYIEMCPKCGSRAYEYKIGSVRIGSDAFLISDPQLLSADIYCRECGELLNQYLLESEEWEAQI